MVLSLQTRIEELERRIYKSHGPGTFLYAAVFCNGCGRSVSAPSAERLAVLVQDWEIGHFGGNDYCPRCQGR